MYGQGQVPPFGGYGAQPGGYNAPHAQPPAFGGQPYAPQPGPQQRDDDRHGGKSKDPVLAVVKWIKARSPKEKSYLLGLAGFVLLALLYFVIDDHDNLFVMSECVHFAGIGALAWKLLRRRAAGGLSLRTQELTAAFLAVRLLCSFVMEYDVHTLLDLLTLGATGAVIYALRGPLRHSYQAELDALNPLLVAAPCLAVAAFAHPATRHMLPFRVLWAFCVYLEAVSVLPQLRMMQKARVVEKFTAHYVFALGLSRFISCAHWVLQIFGGDKYLWRALGAGVWPVMVLLSELVQTFILADFCFYYVKSFSDGTGVIQLPAGVV